MMHSRSSHNFVRIFITILFFGIFSVACTTSQTSSIDDEMLSETEFSEDSSADGNVADASSDMGAEEDFDFSDSSGDSSAQSNEIANNAGDEELELDFDDFSEEGGAQASTQSDDFSEDFADELELDELKAEDVVQTEEPPPPAAEPEFSELDLEDTVASTPTPDELSFDEDSFAQESAPSPSNKLTEITDIRYLANQAGGTVVVDATGALNFESRFNPQNGQYVIEVNNATLPEKLKRPFLMKDFTGSFGSINAYQTPGEGNVRIVVQLKPGYSDEPTVQAEGNSLVVVPPAMTATSLQASQSGGGLDAVAAQKTAAGPLGARTLEEFLMNNHKFYGKPLSLQVRDADIRDVISFISEDSGSNIVMSDQVSGRISLKLRKIPWDQALVSVMRSKNLGYTRQGNVIRISTMKELQDESNYAREMLKAQTEYAPVKAKVIPVNYANVETLQTQVKEFMSKEGRVVVDARSNSILLTDREDILDKVGKIITALDVEPNQVLIEGKIVEASEDFSTTVGVRWSASGSPITLAQTGGALGTPLELRPNMVFGNNGDAVLPNTVGLRLGALDFLGDLEAALSLAESDQTAKIISSPRVLAMNREKAEIGQVGEVISIVTIQNGVVGNATITENRLPVTLKLTVIPQITSDGSVIMDMDVIRQFAGAEVNPTTRSRPINSRTAKTKVLVKNGETAVIGGIYQVDEGQSETGVPLLKDIPVLGWLFKQRQTTKLKNELLIFLTPKIQAASDRVQRAASL